MRSELGARMTTDRFSNSTTSFRNKALDAAEHPDPVVRARESQDLDRGSGRPGGRSTLGCCEVAGLL